MEPDNSQNQTSDIKKTPSKFLRYFLAFNLAALIGFIVWEVGGSSFKRGGEQKKTAEQTKELIRVTLAKNPEPEDFSGRLSGELRYTVDATDFDKWIHFSFSKGTVLPKSKIARDSLEWDMAFRRAKIVTNGGATNPEGKAAVAVSQTTDFELITTVPPEENFHTDKIIDNPAEPKNPAIDKWYKYDFWTHRLTPKQNVYVIRTAKGRYAKFQLLEYYCGDAAACYTFRYVYQGGDSKSFAK